MLKSIESLEGLQEKNLQELQVGILENQTLMDGIHANSVPQSSSDSRKLLENTLVEKLTPPPNKIICLQVWELWYKRQFLIVKK